MARILVRGSKYAKEELRQEEKPFILRIRNKHVLCLIDNDTREAKHAFEYVAGPVRLISPWASVYEINPLEQQMHDLVRKALKSFCFSVADDVIADLEFITAREEAAKLEENRLQATSSS